MNGPAPEPIVFAPLTRTDLVRYAGASGDFNPLHHDHAFATAAGLHDVMGHGMLSAGLLGSAVTTWFGAGSVKNFTVRFRSPVWPGDRLTATCRFREGDADGTAEVDLLLSRGPDDVVVAGVATVRLDRALAAREQKVGEK
ncbi:MAG: dehydratase [Rhizobiaceae bacterium]|nr:dehydratase [Rhizobiaceae bacterium]